MSGTRDYLDEDGAGSDNDREPILSQHHQTLEADQTNNSHHRRRVAASSSSPAHHRESSTRASLADDDGLLPITSGTTVFPDNSLVVAAENRRQRCLIVLTFLGCFLSFISLMMALIADGRAGACCLPSTCSISALSNDKMLSAGRQLWSAVSSVTADKGMCVFRDETVVADMGTKCQADLKSATSASCLFDGTARGLDSIKYKDSSATCVTPMLSLAPMRASTAFVMYLFVYHTISALAPLIFSPFHPFRAKLSFLMLDKVAFLLSACAVVGSIVATPIALVHLVGLKDLSQLTMLKAASSGGDSSGGSSSSTNNDAKPATFSMSCGSASFATVTRVAWIQEAPLVASGLINLIVTIIFSVVVVHRCRSERNDDARVGGGGDIQGTERRHENRHRRHGETEEQKQQQQQQQTEGAGAAVAAVVSDVDPASDAAEQPWPADASIENMETSEERNAALAKMLGV